jgi:hypothetical protein
LGLVVNDKEREIKAWECEGGLASSPYIRPGPTREKKAKVAKPTMERVEADE